MNLNSKIENQKRGGKGDTLPSNDYYTNSYVERLKALGSNVQYSNYLGLTTSAVILTDNVVSIHSIYIPKTSIITGVGWFQNMGGINTLDNYNGIGLYSFDGVNSIELLTSTSNQNLFQTTSGYKTEDFDDVLTINKGIYYIGFLFNKSAGFVDPNLITNSTTAIPDVLMQSVNGLSLNILVSGSNILPTTVNISTATKTTITQIFTLY
jgi:hypothetical protein